MSEESARREGIPFDPKNVLRTGECLRQLLVSTIEGHSDRDRALWKWNELTMKPGKIDHFCDELMRLASEMRYSGNFVKEKACMGITTDPCKPWALQSLLPDEYVKYINLLRQTSPQLEEVAAFNLSVTREKHHSNPEKSDDRQLSTKR